MTARTEEDRMARSKNSGGEKLTKTGFVRSMPADMSPKQIAEKAKERGLTMTAKHVSTIRAKERERSKSAGSTAQPAGQAASKKVSKTAFILGLPAGLTGREAVAKAAAAGITISEKHVSAIRSLAKKKGATGGKPARRGRPPKAAKTASAPAKAAPKNGRRGRKPAAAAVIQLSKHASRLSPLDLLRAAVLAVGIEKATAFVAEEARRLNALLS